MHNLPQAQEIFLGLQLILDKRQRLVAYELLFRSGELNAAHFLDNTQATAQVINYAFSHLEYPNPSLLCKEGLKSFSPPSFA